MMKRRPKRNHSIGFKAKVALAASRGDNTLNELAEQFEVYQNKIVQWKQHLLAHTEEVFYVQVVVDFFCSLAFAKVYNSKMPITACDLLYDHVLPFYEELGVPVGAILTDNGREFCGRPEHHPYELLTAMEDIEHRNTKFRSPLTNGFVERMNRTMLDECFRNLERSHQGYRLQGRTPAQALREDRSIKELPLLMFHQTDEIEEEPKEAA